MVNIKLCDGDLNINDKIFILQNCEYIGVDTETTGLNPLEDRLCLIQLCAKNNVYIIRFNRDIEAINLLEIFKSNKIIKIFHHANFDLRFLMKHLNTNDINNVICTKIAAKLLNGVNESSSLKVLLNKYVGIKIDKIQQTSDWSVKNLTQEQVEYATGDVMYLGSLWEILKEKLKRRDLYSVAQKCYDFLPTNARLHNQDIENIFVY